MRIKIFKLKCNEAAIFKTYGMMYSRCDANLPIVLTKDGLTSSMIVKQPGGNDKDEMILVFKIKKSESEMYINEDIFEKDKFSFSVDSKKFKESVAVGQKDHVKMLLYIDDDDELLMLNIVVSNPGGEILKDTTINAAIINEKALGRIPDYGDVNPVVSIQSSVIKSGLKGMGKAGNKCEFTSQRKGINLYIKGGGVVTNIPFGKYKKGGEVIYEIEFNTSFLARILAMAGFTKGDIKVYIIDMYPVKFKCNVGSIGEFCCYISET